MSHYNRAELAALAALLLATASCEPASITAAREQLGRGPARTFALAVPISQDTLVIGKFLGSRDTTTTASGLLALAIAPESLASAVGQKLRFNNLAFQVFTFSYAQMLSARPDSASLTAIFPVARPLGAAAGPLGAPPVIRQDTVRFATAQGSAVSTATIAAGLVFAEITNHTGCSATISESVLDSTGSTVVTFPATTVPPNGAATDTVNASGITFRGFLTLGAPSVVPAGLCTFATGDSIAIKLRTTTLTLASVTLRNLNETFTQSYAPFAGQPNFLAVDTVVAYGGTFVLTIQNRLPVAEALTLTLNGVTRGGVPLAASVTVPAAPGDGTTTSATLTLDLAGATIRPPAVVAVVGGRVTATTATISPTVTTNAAVVSGTGSLVMQSVAGSLNPATTPELVVPVLEFDEVPSANVDFGDLREAVRGSHLNDATGTLAIRNTAQTALTLSSFTLGVVRLDAAGQMLRDAQGNPLYERDSTTSQPILVTVAQPGSSAVTLARGSTTGLVLQMAPLVDRLVHLLLDSVRTAVVAAGTASAGDGSPSRMTRDDSATVRFALTVGLDVSLPDTGVVFTRTEVSNGGDLEAGDSASVAARLVDATVVAVAANGTPFGVTVNIAIAGDSVPGADVFALPGRLLVGPIAVAAASVDGSGRAVTPTVSTDSISITGEQSRVLLGKKLTAAVRIRLTPPAGGTRGAVRSGDRVIIGSSAAVRVRAGGGQ